MPLAYRATHTPLRVLGVTSSTVLWSLGATCIARIVQGPLAQRCGRQTPPARFLPQLAVLAANREKRALCTV
eukprot:2936356-Prymnesium_polylepis.1